MVISILSVTPALRVLGRVNYFSLYNSMYFKDRGNDRIEMTIYGSLGKLICILKCIDKRLQGFIPIKEGEETQWCSLC